MSNNKSLRDRMRGILEGASHLDSISSLFAQGGLFAGVVRFVTGEYVKGLIGLGLAGVMVFWSMVTQLPGPMIATLGLGVFAFSLVAINALIWAYGKLLRKRLPGTSDDNSQPRPQEIDPYQDVFKDKKVRLADLIFSNDNVIRNKKFENCELFGPAVIALGYSPQQMPHLKDVRFRGSSESSFIETNKSGLTLGVIAFDGVTIIGGSINNVSFIGDAEQINNIKTGFINEG